MKKRSDFIGIIEAAMGIMIYVIPIVCGFFIITWAGKAYHEGYKIFVEESLDAPGFAHSEMVTISAQDAGSALAVGRILEKQDLISSGLTFAIKARLSGYDDKILPGRDRDGGHGHRRGRSGKGEQRCLGTVLSSLLPCRRGSFRRRRSILSGWKSL